ncbi:flagellar brake protein [Erwinia sp. OLTSP20]|uniref:flagellar brake protein n=1 Tax=unclassified Erwinia TaxID=2622719 RepID=UPI000C188573|nr:MULTISPECIES: flagellar brake protein [unclassified Erwinia]PIJ49220.1 flagellar brake protein [Erwinia sp. OAMSP11]PIJ70502.1 flagellar brake protein [Erwinia sp. OLSSP12]PIJ78748.1 flagellar brake protein [Erwinia sp. OLCASP19]PIJ81229.1 flagellar brake protein [Erwinia sp. OLMTSP26]PIJ84478.1 flagellar brake protein [Erwinia sp. OLMDSP33]
MEEVDNEQFLKKGPLAVSNTLKDLLKSQTPVMVSHARGQFISKLLYVDQQQLMLDYSSNSIDNQLALAAETLFFTADAQGARIELTLGSLSHVSYDNLPAFSADLPDQLLAIQRRQFFRVHLPFEPIFWCTCLWPDGSTQRFRLHDLSLGGIGVLCNSPPPPGLSPGELVKNLRVDMGDYGQFQMDVQLISIGQRSVISSKNERRVTPRLSFRFASVTPAQERQLQQVIFALERLAREKTTRFQ